MEKKAISISNIIGETFSRRVFREQFTEIICDISELSKLLPKSHRLQPLLELTKLREFINLL